MTIRYSINQVNKDFLIKVYDHTIGLNSLRGIQGLYDLIGKELAHEYIQCAYNAGRDKYERRVFNGNKKATLKITFYAH